jgi:hypothetical protein
LRKDDLPVFLQCLILSRNYAALQILEPNPALQLTPMPIKLKPINNITAAYNCISSYDIARVIHEKTPLSANWTILQHALGINPGKWTEISSKSNILSLLDTIQLAIEYWSGSLGLKDATVGLLYNNLAEHNHRLAGGRLLIIVKDYMS